ncbi:MAG: DNA topoisomerase, partial [Nanoarchaeota archaeon]
TKGIEIAKEYLKEKKLDNYFVPRKWGEEGAHEAIRPTRAYDAKDLKMLVQAGIIPVKLTSDHYKLYDLIFKRFIASQMKEAKIETIKAKIKFLDNTRDVIYEKEIEIPNKLIEKGFNLISPIKIYLIDKNNYNVNVKKRLVPKVPHYNQGSLVEEMRNRKLGRPSTYATIIQTLLKRAYIIEIKNFLVHTKKGKIVYDYLTQNYPDLVSEEFTRYLEGKMKEIEEKTGDHQPYLWELFKKLEQYNLWETLKWQKEFFIVDLEESQDEKEESEEEISSE